MKNLPYNLIKEYPQNARDIEIIKERILHTDYEWWYQLTKYGLKYISAEAGYCFPSNINIIGMGAYSIVYEIENTNYVIKITNNDDEINWSKQIMKLQSSNKLYEENYIKIFDVIDTDIYSKEIVSNVDNTLSCSIIVIEKMDMIRVGIHNKLEELDAEIYDITGGVYLTNSDADSERIKRFIEEYDKPLTDVVKNILNKFVQLHKDAEKYGWYDYHLSNLMKEPNNNNYKFIDLQMP